MSAPSDTPAQGAQGPHHDLIDRLLTYADSCDADGMTQAASDLRAASDCIIGLKSALNRLKASQHPEGKRQSPSDGAIYATVSRREMTAEERDGIEAALRASGESLYELTPPPPACLHEAIIGLDGKWRCQRCGDAIEMATAHSSTVLSSGACDA